MPCKFLGHHQKIWKGPLVDQSTGLCVLLIFQDVDSELRDVCEQFIQTVSESFISPLAAFLAKVSGPADIYSVGL